MQVKVEVASYDGEWVELKVLQERGERLEVAGTLTVDVPTYQFIGAALIMGAAAMGRSGDLITDEEEFCKAAYEQAGKGDAKTCRTVEASPKKIVQLYERFAAE